MNILPTIKAKGANIVNSPERYKLKDASIWAEGFEEGFDAAIALNLPLKFTTWKDENTELHENDPSMFRIPSKDMRIFYDIQALYKYWINNIYGIL